MLTMINEQPSCKAGTTRWSYSGVSPSLEVFVKMLGLPSGGKPWKQKKISNEDFSNAVGDIQASVSWFDDVFQLQRQGCRPDLLINGSDLVPI